MTTTTQTILDQDGRPAELPPGYMTDSKGRLVPESLVRDSDKLQDQLVRKIIGYAEELSGRIARFRGHTFDDIAAFMDLLSEQYDVKRGGAKGNVTFTSYDGLMKVQVQVAERLTFGPELQVAKELVDECIGEWADGSRVEIRALVDHAFRPDKEGQVSRESVFALRRLQIEDPRWQRAVEAIGESIRIAGSKAYVRFYRRPTTDAAWQPISIDLASVGG